MYLVVCWNSESSYETPRIYGSWGSLQQIAEAFGPGDVVDNREEDDSLFHIRLLGRAGKQHFEVDDDIVAEVVRLQAELD